MKPEDSLLLSQIKSLLQKAVSVADEPSEVSSIMFICNEPEKTIIGSFGEKQTSPILILDRALLPATAKGLLVAIEALEKTSRDVFNSKPPAQERAVQVLLSIIHGFPKELLK